MHNTDDKVRKIPIRVALIGVGYRGKQLMNLLQQLPAFEVIAVADPKAVAEEWPDVVCYNQQEDSYLEMLDEQRPELVFIASPWQLHVQHALQCVMRGCDVALEIKGGLHLYEYQPLITLSKQRGCRIFPLENTLFMREILSVYQMVQEGLLGEIVYMRGGYRHDLRDILLDDTGHIGNRRHTESIWRSRFYLYEQADIYPTHGLAPLCLIAGINRSDCLTSLMSRTSKAAGIKQRIQELGGDTSVAISMGDVITTQLKTAGGILISLVHDTTLPRPRSLDLEVQGTKGIWQGETHRIYLEGISPKESWEDDEPYISRYEHPYWKQWGKEAVVCDTHHQGMDYIMLKAVEADLTEGIPYPADVTDLALWTSITPWSANSIRKGKKVKCTGI